MRYVALACLAHLVFVCAAGAAEPPARPLTLTLRLDRGSYVEYEPIYADWTLANVGRGGLLVRSNAASRVLHFEYRRSEGPWVRLNASAHHDAPPPPLVLLPRSRSLCAWGNLRSDFRGLRGLGTFRLRAVCKTGLFKKGDEVNYAPVTLTSNEVVLRVVEAKGTDARAVRIIREAFPHETVPPGPNELDNEGTRAARRAEEQEYRDFLEVRRGCWYAKESAACDVMNLAGSGRLGRAGRLTRSMGWFDAKDEELREFCTSLLRPGVEPDASSRFMKGLARLTLLRWKLTEKGQRAKQEANEMAASLAKDYAGTAIAQEARELVERAGKPK